ncbi:MAG: PH domain-containing protein [Actinomycetota bacterium]|nr:PH domain-containing protein [Actinomycetota bacterium]
MAFPRRLLVDGEELVLDLRPHPVALLLPAIVTVLTVGVGIWLLTLASGAVTWIVLGGIVLVLVAYPVRRLTDWLTSHFVVTSDRVIHRQGLIAKSSMEIPLEAINDVRFSQGVIDRMLGAGTLVIQSASESGRQDFSHIRKPEDVQRTIYHQGELNQSRMYRGGGAAASPSATTELERLADLRAKGVLTEQEFQAQKARILRNG